MTECDYTALRVTNPIIFTGLRDKSMIVRIKKQEQKTRARTRNESAKRAVKN